MDFKIISGDNIDIVIIVTPQYGITLAHENSNTWCHLQQLAAIKILLSY